MVDWFNDYELSPEQLEIRYSPVGDGEHPAYARKEWREAVAQEETISGYWVWIVHCLSFGP